jgi:predicted DNA-binding transcriptional regulator AlpA
LGNTSAFVPSFDKPEQVGVSTPTESSSFSQPPRKPPTRVTQVEALLTAEDVAKRLNVSTDWVWDHSSRKKPLLPVIRMGDGALRYRPSGIEAFIDERERLSALRRRA